MCVVTIRRGFIFLRQSIWGVTCLSLIWKMHVFPSISLETSEMCVETPRTGLIFFETINLRGHMPHVYSKNECFPIYLLRNPINVCWNPQNRAHFSWDNWFEGLHASVYWKNASFSHQSPLKHHKCVLKPSTQGLFFWDNRFEGSHASGLL